MLDLLSAASTATQAAPSSPVDFMSLLSAANRRRFLQGSTRATYRAGTIAHQPLNPPKAFLIESGLARAFWTIPDGRQTTVGILRPKELSGASAINGQPLSTYMQVITDATLTTLDMDTVTNLALTELEVSVALGKHLAMRVRDADRLVAVRSLGNIRERVAYDLLDRAAQSQLVVGRLEVMATQEDLADSIGSSREVVSRALKDLRMEGIVETAPGLIRVLVPGRLGAIVRAFVI
jgi:CRP/FNR family transcriptional regulator, cyclic AMP receptor protein